jgi:uncharacterized protein (UPF0254 family)
MKDYYKVLEYLPKARVDRQEPVCFTEETFVEGDSIVLPLIYAEFEGTDYVQVFINCHQVEVDVSNITLSFSPLLNGNASVLSVKPKNTEISSDKEDILLFEIDRNNTAVDLTRELTGLESIKIDFGTDVTGVEILNLIIKSLDYTYTLTDIEKACYSGEDYVFRGLNDMKKEKTGTIEIPKTLQRYVYMAAGAFAWLTRWEYEAKPMKEPKSESNNYADRLFGKVDSAIANYLSNIENNRNEEYIQMQLFRVGRRKW